MPHISLHARQRTPARQSSISLAPQQRSPQPRALWLCVVAFLGCSATREPVSQHADDDRDVPVSPSGSMRGVADSVRDASRSDAVPGEDAVPTSTESATATTVTASNDAGASAAPGATCRSSSVTLHFSGENAGRAEVRQWTDGTSTLTVVESESISTPGRASDAGNPWEPLPEAEWDRSATPLASCTVVLRDFDSRCYDLTPSTLRLDARERVIVYNNLRDPALGFNSPPLCDFEPGCRYPRELGEVDVYYVVADGADTRVVLCGVQCDAYLSGSFSLEPGGDAACD